MTTALAKKEAQRIAEEMKELQEVLKLVPTFIKMAENDLGEATHRVDKDLTYEEFERIEKFASRLNTLINYVDQTIFE